jgi:hypothetical protein
MIPVPRARPSPAQRRGARDAVDDGQQAADRRQLDELLARGLGLGGGI